MGKRRGTASLAGGCFRGVEGQIRKLDGVIDTTTGYTSEPILLP